MQKNLNIFKSAAWLLGVWITFNLGVCTFAKESRQKVIDFEDEVVEGVNKRPLDSLSQISEVNRRKKAHLYRKRIGFKSESLETFKMSRFE